MHFAVLALIIFAVYAALAPSGANRPASAIVVSAAKIEQMAAVFAKTWQRPPSPDELKALIDDYVAEEVLVREALTLGLDQDDTVVRRRLRQKMEFMSGAEVEAAPPSEAVLQAYLDTHRSDYEIDPKIGFVQIYLSPDQRGDSLDADSAALLAQLRANPDLDPSTLGDPTLLPSALAPTEVIRIGNDFGPDFASALAEIEPGAWSGPITSAYGLHLVRVTARQPGRTPPLAEVRDEVLRDWSNEERVRREKAQLEDLLANYTVTIETLPEATPSP